MTKKKTTSTNTTPAASPAPRRRAAQKSVAVAAPETAPRHRKSTSANRPAPPASPAITQEDIARLAFSYFEARGYQGGSPEADWLRAEAEIMQLVG